MPALARKPCWAQLAHRHFPERRSDVLAAGLVDLYRGREQLGVNAWS
jgi:hypothetical protein